MNAKLHDPSEGSARLHAAQALSDFWWLPLIRGILLVLMGAYALFRPGMTASALTQVVGVFLILDGIFSLLAGKMGTAPSQDWTLGRGIVEILAGLFVFAYPALVAGTTATLILYVVGFGSIVGGAMEIFAALKDRKILEGEGWLILGGALAVLFGLLLLAAPLSFGKLLIQALGGYAMLYGIALVTVAFRVRNLPTTVARRAA